MLADFSSYGSRDRSADRGEDAFLLRRFFLLLPRSGSGFLLRLFCRCGCFFGCLLLGCRRFLCRLLFRSGRFLGCLLLGFRFFLRLGRSGRLLIDPLQQKLIRRLPVDLLRVLIAKTARHNCRLSGNGIQRAEL